MIYTPKNGAGLIVLRTDGAQLKNIVEADTTECQLTEILLRKVNSSTPPYCKWELDENREPLYRRYMAEFDIVHRETGKIIDRARFADMVPRGPQES